MYAAHMFNTIMNVLNKVCVQHVTQSLEHRASYLISTAYYDTFLCMYDTYEQGNLSNARNGWAEGYLKSFWGTTGKHTRLFAI